MKRAMAHLARAAALGIALAAFAETPDPSALETVLPWNDEVIATLATELHDEIAAGLELASRAPPQETAIQQRTRDGAVTEMKQARAISRSYADRLRQGWNREDSEAFFHQLRSAVERARRTARDAVAVTEVAPHLDRIDALLDELARYYEAD